MSDIEEFRPSGPLAKSVGRITYQDVHMSGISGPDLLRVGNQLASEFPDYEIWVTAGPFRLYDVAYRANQEKKIILVDFYSVRPGFSMLGDLIRELHAKLDGKKKSPSEQAKAQTT